MNAIEECIEAAKKGHIIQFQTVDGKWVNKPYWSNYSTNRHWYYSDRKYRISEHFKP